MRRPLVLGLIGALLVLAVWWFLIFAPKQSDLADTRDDLELAQNEQQTLTLEKARLLKEQERIPAYQAALDQLAQAIPAQPDGAGLIEALNQMAQEAGLALTVVAPRPPAPPNVPGAQPANENPDYYEIGFSLSVEGPYFQALDFIARLEEMPRLVRIEQIEVTPQPDSASGMTQLAIVVEATAFSLTPLPGPPPTATTTTVPPTTAPS